MAPRDRLALGIILVVLLGIPAALIGGRLWRPPGQVRLIEIVANAPDQGGFVPDRLTMQAGEKVRLRISSPDVVHGLLIPELGVDIEEIFPGKPVTLDITAPAAGRYAFACTRWCGVDHWRMRGFIEVTGTGSGATPAPPLFERLGIDLDAMRHGSEALPAARPSAERGIALGLAMPDWLVNWERRAPIAPSEAFNRLRADPAYGTLDDAGLWDFVASAWLHETAPAQMAQAARRFARDCAACHGEGGRGDGVAGRALPGMSKMDASMPSGPADFTNAAQMFSASDALLQGKILRGGMGTGMPEFGSLYTEAGLRDMVSYLRTFLFDAPGDPSRGENGE